MKNAFIIHGTGGSSTGNWFPWLATELEKEGYTVFVPNFPTPENQSLQNWLAIFDPYKQYLNEETIVIGHSLGPAFLLRILEKLSHSIKASFFVSGFTTLLDNPEFDELNRTFVTDPFDWEAIRNNCHQFAIINSDDDPYVPVEKGQIIADHLHAQLTVIKGGGHLNTEAGYTTFPFLLEEIQKRTE